MQSDECQCPEAGYCPRRGSHISLVHWKKCQSGNITVLDRIYAEAKTVPRTDSPPKKIRQSRGVGDYLHEIVYEVTKVKPCPECASEITRLNGLTTLQVLEQKEDIADRIVNRAQRLEPAWWQIHIKAMSLAAGLAPDTCKRQVISWIEEACRRKQKSTGDNP